MEKAGIIALPPPSNKKDHQHNLASRSNSNTRPRSNKTKALLLTILSTFSYSLHAVFVKSIVSVNPYELVSIISLFSLIPSTITLIVLGLSPVQFGPLWHIDILLLCGRGLFGLITDLLRVVALKFLPLGDSSTIMFSNPIIVAALAPFLLNERLLLSTIFAVILTVAGIVLVSQPKFLFDAESFYAVDAAAVGAKTTEATEQRAIGIIAATASSASSAIALILLRAMRHINEHTVIVWAGVITSAGAALIALAIEGSLHAPARNELVYVLLAAVFQYGSNWLVTLAFHYDSAARVSSLRSTIVVWAFAWQVLIFHEQIKWLALLGASFVVLSIGIVGWSRDDDVASDADDNITNANMNANNAANSPLQRRGAYDEVEGGNFFANAPRAEPQLPRQLSASKPSGIDK